MQKEYRFPPVVFLAIFLVLILAACSQPHALTSVPAFLTPETLILEPGSSETLTLTGRDGLQLRWHAEAGEFLEAGSSAVYTAPETEGLYLLTVRVPETGETFSANVQVSDSLEAQKAQISVTVTPTTATLVVGQQQSFTATVSGNRKAVTWRVTGGSLSGTGNTVTYTAPATTGSYIIEATSVADPSKKGSALITVVAASAPRENQIMFGAYVYGGIWGGMQPIYDTEATLGRRLDIVQWFMNWDHAWDANLVRSASQDGRIPLLTWEAHNRPLQSIIEGRYDSYIRSWAQGVKAHGGIVYLRIFPEMNGDWTSWSGDAPRLVSAWRRIADIFAAEGASNVRWVWSPNETDEPRTTANRMENYYPGAQYVHILGIDGYNWGTTRSWSSWRSFEQVFAEPYQRVTALGSQPVWIAELGSAEQGGDKGAWVKGMFDSTAFPRLQALVWFEENKETDWRMASSSNSLQAFTNYFGNIYLAGF